MQSLLASFHLEIRPFSELLNATGAIVAGSAALAALVAGTPYTFTPNDLDIWVHSDFFQSNAIMKHVAFAQPTAVELVRRGHMYIFSYFLRQHGYVEVERPVQSDVEYTSNPVFAILRCIQRFQHPSGRVIQVIHCKVPVEEILDTFDLSVAATWWVPSVHPSNEGFLHTLDPESTAAGVMYSLRKFATDREKERIQKYEARGFTWRNLEESLALP
jgi:hypothetical protein